MAQRDVAIGSLLTAADVTGAGVLPGPAILVTSTTPVACWSACVPAPGVTSPAGAASVTTSPGRCEHARESSHLERHRMRSSGRERSRSGGKRGRSRSSSPACFSRSASVYAFSSSESSDTEERVSAMPPPSAGRPGVGGCRSKSDRSASGRDRCPQPGPSGLGLGDRSATGLAQSIAVFLPPLVRVRWKTTEIVPLVQSILIGMIRFGLFFASSGSSIAWRNWQV